MDILSLAQLLKLYTSPLDPCHKKVDSNFQHVSLNKKLVFVAVGFGFLSFHVPCGLVC